MASFPYYELELYNTRTHCVYQVAVTRPNIILMACLYYLHNDSHMVLLHETKTVQNIWIGHAYIDILNLMKFARNTSKSSSCISNGLKKISFINFNRAGCFELRVLMYVGTNLYEDLRK